MASSCPGAEPMGKGWCILDNLLEESKLGVAAVRNKHNIIITGAYE